MKKTIVFMFSGQGSQYYQMGRELFDSHPGFRRWMTTLDSIAMDTTGRSVLEEIYHPLKNKGDLFDDILYTHPALFMVEYALYRTLREEGVVPDYLLGASLGEYVAAAASGMMDHEQALKKVISQAQLYTEKLGNGGMIAVLDDPVIYYRTPLLKENSEISAFNLDSHFVITLQKEKMEEVTGYLTENGTTHLVLPVEYPFHASCMDHVREEIISLYRGVSMDPPVVETVSCAHAGKVKGIGPEYFWNAVRKPILFSKTIYAMNSSPGMIYLDLGPSGTLSTFTKYLLSKDEHSETFPVMTPFGRDLANHDEMVSRFSHHGKTGKGAR